jgi:hypothetical protein
MKIAKGVNGSSMRAAWSPLMGSVQGTDDRMPETMLENTGKGALRASPGDARRFRHLFFNMARI